MAGFTFWSEVRSSQRVDALVSEALGRATLIGGIRVNALSLESAIEAHIRANDDEDRAIADAVMTEILADIQTQTTAYTRSLGSAGRLGVWQRFNDTCHSLAREVRAAATVSKQREPERARRFLVQKIRPLVARVDLLAGQLAQENAAESRQLSEDLGALRVRTTAVSAGLTLVALALSLLVGRRTVKLLDRQEATIDVQLAELGRRNHELDAFASRVAHDLLSPLSPLKGYLTLIRRTGGVTEPQAVEMLALAEASCTRMGALIEALLRFCRSGSKVETGTGELDTAVSSLLLEVSQTAASQNVALERSLASGVRVGCPSQLLQLIAQNLLSNAVKYSAGQPEARVKVRVAREGHEAVLEVEDNGLGITEAAQASLFQPFFRAPEARALPGNGLGLATAKRLVEAYGGTLALHSRPGEGTRVSVRFPLQEPLERVA